MTYLENLRYYQKEAVENIYEFFKSDKCKAKMYISTGLGKTLIIAVAIQTILKNNNAIKIYVLYLWQSVKQYLNVSKYCLTDSILEKSRKNEI